MITLLLALCLQDPAALPTEKDAQAAIDAFKKAASGAAESDQLKAAKEALQTKHERVVKTVGELLGSGSDSLRTGVALAIGGVDHPASVDALVLGLQANAKHTMVLAAIAKALGTLGWESGAAPLHDFLKKIGEPDVRDAIPDIVNGLAAIGSPTSVDLIIDLLQKLQNGGRRDPWPNEGAMIKAAQSALQSITGGKESAAKDWDAWWKANKQTLLAGAKITWWAKKTMQRTVVGSAEKPPADAILVGTRLTDAPAPKADPAQDPAKKKKKKGN